MARLPNVGGDDGNWGTLLNQFLQVAHNSDGTLANREINVKDHGAKGDGVADDTAAIQNALDTLAPSGGCLYVPPGTYLVSAELTYNLAAAEPLLITGVGAASVLKASGASNKILHITGTPGATTTPLLIQALAFRSQTSGTCAAAVHLDGISEFSVHDLDIRGTSKISVGIRCTAAQQGEISGGYISQCSTGILLEASAGVSSNGLDIHGVSLANSGTNIVVTTSDSTFIKANHLTSAPIGIDITGPTGSGIIVIAFNHIESHTTAGVRIAAQQVSVVGNSFFTGAAGIDLIANGGNYCLFEGNLFNGSINLTAGCDQAHFINNTTAGGTFTDNSTNITKHGNRNTGGGPIVAGATLIDALTLTSRAGAAGDILKLNPNAGAGGAWGMSIAGAGANQDVYLSLSGVVIAGTTSGGVIKFLAGVGGTEWGRIDASGLHARIRQGFNSPTYGTTVGVDASLNTYFYVNVTNSSAFTISNPVNPLTGMQITYDIANNSGGAMGTITWGTSFLLAGAFTNPANGKRRTITFYNDGTNWIEMFRVGADI